MISFLPDTVRNSDGSLTVELGEYFPKVELVLKRTVFDGMKQEEEEITIEVEIRRLMAKTLAAAGKPDYDANTNIAEWQELGSRAKATGEDKYKAAEIKFWSNDNSPFKLGPVVEESFLSLKDTSLNAFGYGSGITVWKADLPCLQYIDNSPFTTGPIQVFDADMPNLMDGYGMFDGCSFLGSFRSKMPSLTNATYMFRGCSLTSWTVELPNSLTDASSMFSGCSSLTSWNGTLPNSLTDASYMFYGCSGLTSWTVELPNSITDASGMFEKCSGLTSWTVALPNSLTDASAMFAYCSGLTSWTVALPNSLTYASGMFQGCSGLTSWTVALPNSITNAQGMFSGCSSLTSWTVALPNSLRDASSMFSGCSSLTSWNGTLPNSLTNASYMFSGCKLDKESLQRIAGTIPDVRGVSGNHQITIGYDSSKTTTSEANDFKNTIAGKGWTVTMQSR